jgi:hypothetical protein
MKEKESSSSEEDRSEREKNHRKQQTLEGKRKNEQNR